MNGVSILVKVYGNPNQLTVEILILSILFLYVTSNYIKRIQMELFK